MPSGAGNPHKNPPQQISKRTLRKSNNATVPPTGSSLNNINTKGQAPSQSPKQYREPRQSKVRDVSVIETATKPAVEQITPNTTPTKPAPNKLTPGNSRGSETMTDPRKTDMSVSEGEAPATNWNGTAINRAGKGRGRGQARIASPMSNPKATPRNNSRQDRVNSIQSKPATAQQAYAGPTFHASPAPSALPMPKFLSRSVPAADKVSHLKAMMDEDLIEVSQDSGPESPLMDSPSRLAAQRKFREESPLNILFQTDKERRSNGLDNIPAPKVTGDGMLMDRSAGLHNLTSQNTCHSNSRSMVNMFQMEMDGANHFENTSKSSTQRPPDLSAKGNRPTTAPSNLKGTIEDEEAQRKAKTEALKKLLFSPPPQRPLSASPRFGVQPNAGYGFPSPDGPPRPPPPSRNLSGPSTHVPDIQSQNAYSLPLQHLTYSTVPKSFASPSPANGSPFPRPASNLRKEVTIEPSSQCSDTHELPSSPTPLRHSNTPTPAGRYNNRSYHANKTQPTISSLFGPNHLPEGLGDGSPRNDAFMKTMEDDLRRILKLDSFGGDGANGVRS